LKQIMDKLLSNLGFRFNVRHYTMGEVPLPLTVQRDLYPPFPRQGLPPDIARHVIHMHFDPSRVKQLPMRRRAFVYYIVFDRWSCNKDGVMKWRAISGWPYDRGRAGGAGTGAAAAAVGAGHAARGAAPPLRHRHQRWQGLTLVHFSAQPKPFW
jgi:hypothetical protein